MRSDNASASEIEVPRAEGRRAATSALTKFVALAWSWTTIQFTGTLITP